MATNQHDTQGRPWNLISAMVWALLLCTAGIINAQTQYPPIIWVPVTYYDFHSDQSCPEFEPNYSQHATNGYSNGPWTGMIKSPLVAATNYKPVLNDGSCHTNAFIKYWYRPWNQDSAHAAGYTIHAQGDNTKPSYDEWGTIYTTPNAGTDTVFKNMVIHDSLPFKYVTNSAGLYTYINDDFFPLDSRGFGKEGRAHNFSFTMELHTKFTQKNGLIFNFAGDDDVWAFIDNKIQMDLGGLHPKATASFVTDNLGLVNGAEYNFDLFYAERHTDQSHIEITTNLVSTHIATRVTIDAVPSNATIMANDTVAFTGSVWYDSVKADGSTVPRVDMTLSSQINWDYVVKNANSKLTSTYGRSTKFTSTQAWQTYTITASYDNFGNPVSATMVVTVIPNKPYKL
jgi:fibro-slime domain-containing protein